MKRTGMLRDIDSLGRIVVPKELYDVRDIKHGDPLDVFFDHDMIVLQKHETGCVFCGESDNVVQVHNKLVCETCKQEIQTLARSRYN